MKNSTLDLLACPACHELLKFTGKAGSTLLSGSLTCSACEMVYPIENGIPHFIQPEQLTGFNRRFARAYDRTSWGYRAGGRSRP